MKAIPEEAYSGQISDYQFRLLAFLCRFSGHKGLVEATVEQMASGTGNVAIKTVRRALQGLEQAGYIYRTATKSMGGRRGRDKVYVSDSNVHTLTSYQGDSNVHATPDYVANSRDSQYSHIVHMSHISQVSNKYISNSVGVREEEKAMPIGKYDDGDDLVGFGLIEPREQELPKIKKNDPKTRGKRPQHEWTPMDVAAEFSYRVGRLYPWLPGTVNVSRLSGALAKWRKQFNTTALIELELLNLFMADDSNFRNIGTEAPNLYKSYLASFNRNMNKARENMGMSHLGRVDISEPSAKLPMLTASDGSAFDDTIAGRAELKRYEERLKR
jgi:DNA-binding transcriptional regulator YhcF (GntR family)